VLGGGVAVDSSSVVMLESLSEGVRHVEATRNTPVGTMLLSAAWLNSAVVCREAYASTAGGVLETTAADQRDAADEWMTSSTASHRKSTLRNTLIMAEN
jgi:hypothetical protein